MLILLIFLVKMILLILVLMLIVLIFTKFILIKLDKGKLHLLMKKIVKGADKHSKIKKS